MKNVIFIAPPAAGKGTQSSKLVEDGYIHISTGDMLREEIKKDSLLGKEIKDIMAKGLLVSDDVVFELIKKRVVNLKKPFILDGFPRTITQAKMLDELFEELNIKDYEVIYLEIGLEEALKRALGRLSCECGASYNIYNKALMPKVEGICDRCGLQLKKRNDDNEEAFQKRFDTFIENSEPIKRYYEEIKKLHIVNTNISNDEITKKVKDILK